MAEIPRCENCRWWNPRAGYGQCRLADAGPIEENGLQLRDGGNKFNYDIWLCTKADFHCCKFERKLVKNGEVKACPQCGYPTEYGCEHDGGDWQPKMIPVAECIELRQNEIGRLKCEIELVECQIRRIQEAAK